MIALALAAVLAAAQHARAQAAPSWRLVWSDEFDGPDGAAPDPAKWTHELGAGGWGNQELEYYTDRRENSRLEGGSLAIVARRENFGGGFLSASRDGGELQFGPLAVSPFTSARLVTFGKFERKYGRFEARIKIPAGKGLWPAFWLLGADHRSVGWPECGEIDVMENVGHEPSTAHGSIHGPGYSGADGLNFPFVLRQGAFADGFHVFGVEWEPGAIRFYVDGSLYGTRTPAGLPAGGKWVFDKPFFMLLNLAVGGGWPGSPEPSLPFPKTMLVDYVRVYAPQAAP